MKKNIRVLLVILLTVIVVACESSTEEIGMYNGLPEGAVIVDIDGHQVIMLDGMAIGMYGDDIQWGLKNENRIPTDTNTLGLEMHVIEDMFEFESLNLDFGETMIELFDFDHFNFSLSTPQDTLYFIVQNHSGEDKNGLLILFYNYQEISFRIAGRNEYISEFLFQIPNGKELIIPIQLYSGLSVNDSVNSLIVGLFESPEKYSMNGGITRRRFATIVNLGISFGGNNKLDLQVSYQEKPKQIENVNFLGVQINQEFEATSFEYVASTQSPNPLRVYPGELVEFAFNVNATSLLDEEIEDYLIISMIDWQQIDKNGQPFLLVEARYDDMRNDVLDQGRFIVEMPKESGFYEFVTFIVPNPMRFNENTFGFLLELSFPFTIEVVDE